jgi:RNA polymerase sigma-70 factor (ECF subfamily)
VFVRRLERHLGSATADDLARIRCDDFYLACACAEGDDAAIRAFERRFAGVIDGAVARFARTDERRAELKQLVRQRLFVAPPGAEPRIASYSGRGFLENWLRVAAVRACINAERGAKLEDAADDEALDVLPDGHDLELGFLKSHYRSAFRSAFARAVERLAPAERLVLRLSVLEGLTCDELAASLGVHRATAARRTARARQQLVDGTREELARSLRVDAAELESLLDLVESNLDLSISRLLGADEAPEG